MTPRILVIAGSDSGGGAGIQADIKTITMLGGFAMTAITAITAQNTLGVQAIHMIPPSVILAQLDAVADDIGVDAIKIGMLGDVATIHAISGWLTRKAYSIPVILDPVMQAKGGAALLPDEAAEALMTHLMPLATLITPNIPEAEMITGIRITDTQSMKEAAEHIITHGAKSVLIKGGHGAGEKIENILLSDGLYQIFSCTRIDSVHTHGTGCTLASALATYLAQGDSMSDAIHKAQHYIEGAITHAPHFGAGHGPMHHGWITK